MVSFFGLKRYDVELSPPVKGRITDNGKPVVGVEVVRRLFYSGYDKENALFDYSITNDNGEFGFDEKIVKSRSPGDIFGQNIPISQKIYTKNKENKNYLFSYLWRVSKGRKSVPTLSNLMSNLHADLQNSEFEYTIDTSGYNVRNKQMIISICDWSGEKVLEKFDNVEFDE